MLYPSHGLPYSAEDSGRAAPLQAVLPGCLPHTGGTRSASPALRPYLTPEIGPSVTVSGGSVVVMTIRVMSSGKGYEDLLKSVVVGDGGLEMSSPLTRYYTESSCPGVLGLAPA